MIDRTFSLIEFGSESDLWHQSMRARGDSGNRCHCAIVARPHRINLCPIWCYVAWMMCGIYIESVRACWLLLGQLRGGSNTADRRWWECIKPKRVGKVKRCSAWTTHKKWISVLFFGYFTFYSISSIRQRLFTVEWCIKLNENYLTSNFCVEKFYRPKCRRQSRGRVCRMEWPAYP